jgi:membrane protease YdiL (CAAX protease family)
MEFDLIHKALTLVLLLIYVYFLQINIGLTWKLELLLWIKALLITLLGIFISSIIAIKIKFVKLGWLKSDWKELFITSVNMFFFVALPEEIFFRGLIYTSLVQFTGNIIVSLIISIIIFGLAHFRYGVGMVLLGGLTGIFYGLVYVLTGNLYCVAIMHTLVNLFRKYYLINNPNK